MRVVRARIFALLAAVILLLPSGVSARSQYYCRMMGGIVASCCCGADARTQPQKHAQELESADCCQRLSPATKNASLGTRLATHGIAAAAALPAVRECFRTYQGEDTGTSCTESTQAPLAIGPPLFVVHCALLS
jgi:hypothetical protein